MSDLFDPTLQLFLYDLRDGLGQSKEEISSNRDYFKQRLPENIRSSLSERDEGFEAEYVELLKDRIERFQDNTKRYDTEGYYYPVRLSDTYGLLLECSVQNKTASQSTECFKNLRDAIEERIKLDKNKATLGQTWVLSGFLQNFSSKRSKDVANVCYKALTPTFDWEEDYQVEGDFLGGVFFELWRYSLVMKEEVSSDSSNSLPPDSSSKVSIESIQQNHHVIIIIYANELTTKRALKFNLDWMRLFCYRSKIMWAYGQSRYLKQKLKKHFLKTQDFVKKIENNQSRKKDDDQRLDIEERGRILDEIRNTLSQYSIDLSYLDDQNRTIDINLYNYQKRSTKIEEKADQELEFLKCFSNETTNKYLLQIKKDHANFSPGLRLLENLINYI